VTGVHNVLQETESVGLMLRGAALHCPLRHGLQGTLRLKYARLPMQLQWHTALARVEVAAPPTAAIDVSKSDECRCCQQRTRTSMLKGKAVVKARGCIRTSRHLGTCDVSWSTYSCMAAALLMPRFEFQACLSEHHTKSQGPLAHLDARGGVSK
jgi:hypothetical protein